MKKSILKLTLASLLVLGMCPSVGRAAETQKPSIKILTTGGTIAGAASDSAQLVGYQAGALGGHELLRAVPQVQDVANVDCEEVAQIDSCNITSALWLKLAKRCNELLAQSDVDGIVITHGTDTMEETAYFLNLVVKSKKPVVLVGAMRPATAMSADGPLNLLNAVKTAAAKTSQEKGVLVVMNDYIYGARDVTKTNTTNVATFKAFDMGALGYVTAGEPYYYHAPARKHTFASEFNLDGVKALPRVDIVYTHADEDGVLVDACVKAGAKGIVYAGSGMGSVHEGVEPALLAARAQGVAVVRATRVPSGMVVDSAPRWTEGGFINSDNLNPQKARILLQLALLKTQDVHELQRYFDEY